MQLEATAPLGKEDVCKDQPLGLILIHKFFFQGKARQKDALDFDKPIAEGSMDEEKDDAT